MKSGKECREAILTLGCQSLDKLGGYPYSKGQARCGMAAMEDNGSIGQAHSDSESFWELEDQVARAISKRPWAENPYQPHFLMQIIVGFHDLNFKYTRE